MHGAQLRLASLQPFFPFPARPHPNAAAISEPNRPGCHLSAVPMQQVVAQPSRGGTLALLFLTLHPSLSSYVHSTPTDPTLPLPPAGPLCFGRRRRH